MLVVKTEKNIHNCRRTLFYLSFFLIWIQAIDAEVLRINGSTTVNPCVVNAAEILRVEKGMEIHVDTQGGSSGGITSLGRGLVQIAMASKYLSLSDRRKFPSVDFHSIQIGLDAVALVVSRDVWEGGVRKLSKTEVRQIYEGGVTNWKDVGGPDRRIVFFCKEPGRGTWEVFASWLYGDAKCAPFVNHPEVGSNEETRNKVASTRGSFSQLSASWADNKQVYALAVRTESGDSFAPSRSNVTSGQYPICRPLNLITRGEPVDEAKIFIDFMLAPQGQVFVNQHGYVSVTDLSP